jgi:diaminopimelate epimerase
MNLVKAHAYGNDFLLLDEREVARTADPAALARAVCDRHRGVGADGLVIFAVDPAAGGARASMRLRNADGSHAEISGNGLRCLAAWMAHRSDSPVLDVETDAGLKRLEVLQRDGSRVTFRASMGHPEDVRQQSLDVDGATVSTVTLRVGNPQCVVLGEVSVERLHTLAAPLAAHPHFPAGTNVELAAVDAPDRVRVLIWERGVGPTEASGTGACAAAVAAMLHGSAARDVYVESPGGTQRVEWRNDGLYLTGWAEVVAEVRWLAAPAVAAPWPR